MQDRVTGTDAREPERAAPQLVRRRHVLLREGVERRRPGRAGGRGDRDHRVERRTEVLAEGMSELVARALLQLPLVVLAEEHGQPLEIPHGA